MNTDNLIIGAGGGKGGGSARAAVEAKNTLRSRQFARIVDLICEGEVEGLVGSNISAEATEKSIYFDGVPLRNETGQPNFDTNAFSWAFVPGTQNQPVIPTGGTVASEVQVSQEVKYGNTGGGPVVRSISEQYIDSCRVTVLVPRLTVQNTENGDINGGNIVFAIDVQNNGGGFVEVMRPTIEGKTNSEYQRSYEFDLPEPGPWDIRVRRITLDAETSNIQNQLYWSTFTKIVKQPLSYPNTALMGLKVDSALFNRVPSRAYKMRLLKVRVPSNYNPETRAYVGMWDGTFKTAWTDNPAWCWYDLATNTRYGLGEYLDSDNIDKWTLYQIAQYCDELVSDGRGGQEPRFTCNLYINTREEALKVLMNMASIFRGIVYWHSNTIFCSQDRPSSPVKLFTPANVIDGVFTYSGSAKQARHTVAYVSWNDPENLYKQTVEYVEDRESILRLGVRETEVTAMGCTSRSQANRLGRWILLTEREETDTVTFRTGLEGCGVMPGEIIQTTDPSRSGTRLGGRIISATSTSIQLDGEVTLEPGRNYTIAVLLPSGTIEEKLVNWAGGQDLATSTLQLNSQLAEIPQKNAIWILQADNLVAELWRVVSAVEASTGVIELTAVEHIPGKYAAIEQNLKLEPRPTSQINIRPSAVTNLVATTDVKKLNSLQYTTRIFVSWTPPKEGAARYIVTWRRGTDNDKTSITNDPAFDIDDVPAGTFEISVVAENAIGLRGPATTITHVVSESDVEADVQNLRLDPNFLGKDCPITWDRLDWAVKYTVQVYNNSTLLREVPVLENKYVYTYTQNTADGGPYRNLEFKVKAHSWRGTSANWATLAANNPAPATPVGVSLEAGPGQVSITADKPEDQDLAGMIVLMGETPQTVNQLIYKGRDNAFMKTNLQAGILVYFKVAFYDDFGDTGLNYSSIVSTRPLAFGGIKSVTGLPDSPADVAGDTAVFLDVPETTGQRGLWGWDGTTWKYTRDGDYLVANSVTAEKINALNLSSISANLGTITGGNLTLAADGFIKGGATNYSSGTGFWMGNDSGTYKLRAGSPQSSGFEWDGSAFNVYGPDGSVTISSGVVDWEKISGTGKPADNATRNVFRGDWTTSTSYAVGDIVLKDGNGWSCVLAHTSASGNQPPASGNGNTWWALYAVKGSDGAQGLHALTMLVPNNAHTLPAASDGVVASYTGSGTAIQIFEGTTALSAVSSITANGQFTVGTPTQVPASTITVGARSYAGTTATVAQHSAMLAGTDSVVVTYPITVRRTDGTTVTLSATQTLTKSKAGPSGTPGDWVSYVFRESASKPTTPTGTSTLPADWLDSPPSTYTNPIWMSKATVSGATGLAGTWSSPVQVTGVNGTNGASGADGSYVVFQYAKNTSATTAPTSGWTASPPSLATGEFAWMRSGTVIPPATSPASWGTGYRVSGEKGEPGLNGSRTAILDMYRWATSAPTTFPSGNSTYTWATGQFTAPATTNGWSLTPPAPVAGQTLWIARTLYSDSLTTATTSIAWSATTAIPLTAAGTSGTNGTNGANGTRTAYLELYRWAASVPTTFPSGTSTYTWATGTFTAPGTLNGWSLTPGAAVAAQTLWACAVTYADNNTTATSSVAWSTSTAFAIGAAGTNGTNGVNAKAAFLAATSQVFQIAKNGTITPSSITLTATGQNVTGSPTFSVTSGTATLTGTGNTRTLASTGLTTDAATIKITWDGQEDFVTIVKVREGNDGSNGAPGSDGQPGVNSATAFIYRRATSAPALPTANATYTFATGAITELNNSWTATVPTGTNPLYVATAVASGTGATATIAPAAWATPVVLAQNGADGSSGADGAPGLNTATVYLFRRTNTATAPALPTTTSTYTFSTSLLTGQDNSWTTTLPTTGGSYRWMIMATAASTTNTDTIGAAEWAAAVLLAEDGAAGATGATGPAGASGTDGITVVVSNEAHTLPASSAGAVSSYTDSGTPIQVYEGATLLSAVSSISGNSQFTIGTPTQAPASTITVGGRTYSGTTATVAVHSEMVAGTDSVTITYPITIRRANGSNITINKTQTITKSKAGATGANGTNGADGIAYWLMSSAPAIQKSATGVFTPAIVTYTIKQAVGATAPSDYAGRFIIATSTDGTNYTNVYTSLANESSRAFQPPTNIKTLRVRAYLAGGTTTLVDELITTIVSDGATGATGAAGANAIVAVLSNESHVVPTDSAGNNGNFTGATTTLTIFNGATDDSANWTYSVTKTNVTCTEAITSRTQTVTAMSADVGYVDFTATRSGYASVTRRFTISKSKAGSAGSTGAQGDAGPTVTVNPNRAATFTATDNTVDASQANIVFTASVTGLSSPTYAWTFTRQDGTGTTPTASTSSTYTITQANFGSSKAATVTCTVNGIYTDTYTIVLLNRSTAAPYAVGVGNPITSSNATTYIANAAIGAAQIGSINLVGTSNFAVKTAASGARMDMDSRRIKVFDASGVLRVQLGDLTA